MSKKFMINIVNKEIQKYNLFAVYREKPIYDFTPCSQCETNCIEPEPKCTLVLKEVWKECSVFYIKPTNKNHMGYEIFDKSKNGFKIISYDPDSYDTSFRIYLIYSNDGKTLLKEYRTRCGFDRGPKLGQLIHDLWENYKPL